LAVFSLSGINSTSAETGGERRRAAARSAAATLRLPTKHRQKKRAASRHCRTALRLLAGHENAGDDAPGSRCQRHSPPETIPKTCRPAAYHAWLWKEGSFNISAYIKQNMFISVSCSYNSSYEEGLQLWTLASSQTSISFRLAYIATGYVAYSRGAAWTAKPYCRSRETGLYGDRLASVIRLHAANYLEPSCLCLRVRSYCPHERTDFSAMQ